MKTCSWKVWWCLVTLFVSFGGTGVAWATDICHSQRDEARWKLLSVGQRAVDAHLLHHDDALPGGMTSQTGTMLDENCMPVEPASCDVPGGSCTFFLTSQRFSTNLGGLDGADDECQFLAYMAELDGSFKAWLSDSTTNARDRLTQASVPYVRVDGVLLALDFSDLTDGELAALPNVDENGVIVQLSSPMTGTQLDGVSVSSDPIDHCEDWQAVGPLPLKYAFGTSWDNPFPGSWTFNAFSGCVNEQRLYCVEQ